MAHHACIRTLLISLIAGLVLVVASPGHAATVELQLVTPPAPSDPCGPTVCSLRGPSTQAFLNVRGEGNENNRVEVAPVPDGVVVTDRVARLRAGQGCSKLTEHRVRCDRRPFSTTVAVGPGDDAVRLPLPGQVYLGPGNDRLRAGAGSIIGEGGRGNDELRTGRGADTLSGGPGNDVLSSGPGQDTLIEEEGPGPATVVGLPDEPSLGAAARRGSHGRDRFDGGGGPYDLLSYAGRRRGLRVSLVRGRASEDSVAGVERVQGGSGADVIVGGDEDNYFLGEGGRDTLIGRDGNDVLEGGGKVSGGRGRDDLSEFDPNARVDCGPGRDRVTDPRADTSVDRCDFVGLDSDNLPVLLPEAITARTGALLTFTAYCCRVRVTLRAERGMLLAARTVRPRARTRFSVPVTPRARRALLGRRETMVRVTIRLSGQPTDGRRHSFSFVAVFRGR